MADNPATPAVPAAAPRPAATGWILMVVGMAISALLILFGPGLAVKAPITSEAGIDTLVYAVIFLPMALIGLVCARIDGFSAFRAGDAPGSWAAAGLATGVFGLGIAAAFAALAGTLVPGQGSAVGGLILAGVVVILVQTGAEELFFRGWLFKSLEGRIGAWAAIGLSALLFAAFHVLNSSRAPMALLNLLLGGIWFALLAWRSGGLIAPLLAHFGWNASEELIAGLSPNPAHGVWGSFKDWDLVGSPLWGGSEEGLNTSIGMAVVLIALIVPLVWRPAPPAVAAEPATA